MSATFDDRQVKASLRRLGAAAPAMMARALFMEGQIEMGEAKRRTPVDTGALRSSGRVSPPVVTLRNTSVTLSFGGPARGGVDVGYAVRVHEDLSAFHPSGGAKYLESVILESRAFMRARVGKRIESELARI